MGVLDYIIILAVVVWFAAAIVYMLRLKKKGRSVCCGSSGCKNDDTCPGCSGCKPSTSSALPDKNRRRHKS